MQITHVAETHIHNDYVTGGLQLAKDHQAVYLALAASFPPCPCRVAGRSPRPLTRRGRGSCRLRAAGFR
ncbi:hypothetical protein DDA93_13680 [Arthrobacter sp. Bz4]|nr:hypothetical protein DDA93_13680 [Arthrobacter sp. Bz4]